MKRLVLLACGVAVFSAVACGGPSARGALAALAEDDLERAREIYAAGADPNEMEKGQTALTMVACYMGSEVVDLLLEAGADPDLRNRRRLTPLIVASRCGNLAFVQRLLELGADPDLGSPGGTTALMAAREAGEEQVAQALLEAGATEGEAKRSGRRKATGY